MPGTLDAASQRPAKSHDRLKDRERPAAENRLRAKRLAEEQAKQETALAAQRAALVAKAARVREAEETLTRLEAERAALDEDFSRARNRLSRERVVLGRLMLAMSRLAGLSKPGLLASSEAPIDAARAQILLRSAIDGTRDRALALSQDQTRLDELGRALESKTREIQDAALALTNHRGELTDLIARRQALTAETDVDRPAEAERNRRLTEKVETPRDLVARIEAETVADSKGRTAGTRGRAPDQIGSGSSAAGTLPVAGAVTTRFGETGGAGTVAHGLTIATRPGATVTLPTAGVVRFAGPFRDDRQILIVAHPGGYLTLIAGMGHVNVGSHQVVGAGEPVGAMDERPDTHPELYYEVRRDGESVDPLVAARMDGAADGRGGGAAQVKGKVR